MPRLVVPLVILLAALVVTPAAHAQWDPSATAMLGQGYGQTALSQAAMTNAFNAKGGKQRSSARKPKVRKPTKRQLATLRFKPTAERTQANAPQISQILLAACPPDRAGCPVEHAALIAQGIDTGDHRTRFRQNVRALIGGSDRNVGDAVTTFIVMTWAAQRPSLNVTAAQRKGARRTAADLRNQLALSAPVRRLSDAHKQRLVETLGAIAQHTLALRHAYTELGHPGEADKLTRYLRDVTRRLTSVDVSKLKLTRKGFAKR